MYKLIFGNTGSFKELTFVLYFVLCHLFETSWPAEVDLRLSIYYVREIFMKTNISYPLIRISRCENQGVRKVEFSKSFV